MAAPSPVTLNKTINVAKQITTDNEMIGKNNLFGRVAYGLFSGRFGASGGAINDQNVNFVSGEVPQGFSGVLTDLIFLRANGYIGPSSSNQWMTVIRVTNQQAPTLTLVLTLPSGRVIRLTLAKSDENEAIYFGLATPIPSSDESAITSTGSNLNVTLSVNYIDNTFHPFSIKFNANDLPITTTSGIKLDGYSSPRGNNISFDWMIFEGNGYIPIRQSTMVNVSSDGIVTRTSNSSSAQVGNSSILARQNGNNISSYAVELLPIDGDTNANKMPDIHIGADFDKKYKNFVIPQQNRLQLFASTDNTNDSYANMSDQIQNPERYGVFASLNPDIATVTADGIVTPLKPQTFKVTYTLNGSNKVYSTYFYATENGFKNVDITQSLTTGQSSSVDVRFSSMRYKKLVWSSDNSDIVTVDQYGSQGQVNGDAANISPISSNQEGQVNISVVMDDYYTASGVITVKDPRVTITINGNSTMDLLSTQQLTVNVSSGTLPIRSRVWSSSDTNILTVDQNGNVSGVNPGQATIYYTINNKQQSGFAITVGGVSVVDVDTPLYIPKQRQLKAVSKNNSNYVFNNAVFNKDNTSNNDSIVSSSGLVTAKSAGSLGIYVYPNGNMNATPTRVSLQTALNQISISTSNTTHYSGQGGNYNLSATVPPDSIVWASTNTNVVTIDQSGNYYGVSEGTVTITAYVDNFYTVTDTLTIVDPQVQVSVNGNKTMQVQSSQNLTATVNAGSLPIRSRVWSSSNPNVLSVDQQGVVTANDIGRATITYSINSKYNATFDIVSNNYSVQIAGDLTAAMVGDLKQYQYKVTPDGLSITDVQWTIDNTNIAKIESSDNGNCRVRAISVGSTTINLLVNGRYKTSVTLVVTEKRKTTDRTITPTITLGRATFNAPTLHVKRNFPAQPINVVIDGATSIIRGKGYQAAYHFEPSDNMDITDEYWWTSNNDIATVSNSGWIQTRTSGNVTIYCRINGNYVGSLGLTINDPPPEVIDVQSVTLTGPSTVMKNHQLSGFSYTVNPSNATIKSVVWDNSNSGVLSNDIAGNFTGVSVGSADAIVRVNGVEARQTVSVTPEIINVQGATISGPDNILDTGNADFTVKINPSNATSTNGQGAPSVSWSVSNSSLAGNMQSTDGTDNWRKQNYFAKQVGTTGYFDVIVSVNGVTARKTVQINLDKSLKSVIIIPPNNMTPSSDVVYRGSTTGNYTYSFSPSYADVRSVTWSSLDNSVASLVSNGSFKGVGEGDTAVHVVATDANNNSVSSSRGIHVAINRGVSSYGINPGENKPINGSQYIYSYYVKPIDPQVSNPDVNSVVWSTSNPSIFRSDGGGQFTALATGNASVQVSINGGPNATFDVTVKPLVIPVQSATITGPNSFYDTSSPQTYKITWSPSNATASDGSSLPKTISWSLSDTNLLNSQSNILDGLNVWAKNKGVSGSATITAKLDGKSYTKNIQIQLDKSITSIAINPPTSTDVVYGHNNIWRNFTTQKYTFSYTPSYADVGNITWGTDNTNIIQYVPPNGNVEFDNQVDDYVSVGDRFKGINQGSANVTLAVTDKNGHTFNSSVPLTVTINTGITDYNIASGEKNPVVGKQYKYSYTVTPIDPQVSNPTYSTPNWSSSNSSILRSDGGGYFTAIAPGNANVQMSIDNGPQKTYAVTVQADNSLKTVTIVPPNNMSPSSDMVYRNATTDGYTYTFSPSSANIASAVWSSQDTSVVNNSNGSNKFTGVSPKGSTNVMLTLKDTSGNTVTATRQLSTKVNNTIVDYTLDSTFISANGQEDYDHGWIYTVTYTLVTSDPDAAKLGQPAQVNTVDWSTDDDTGTLVNKGNGKFWLQWAGQYFRAYVSINGGPKKSIVIHQDESTGQ